MSLPYRKKKLLALSLAAILACALVWFMSLFDLTKVLESKFNRHVYRGDPYKGQDYSVVVVAIDELSFDTLKRDERLSQFKSLNWPWPPVLHALLLQKLAGYGADRVGFDILFSEPFEAYRPEYATFEPLIQVRNDADIPVVLASKNEQGITTDPLPQLLENGFGTGRVNTPVHVSGEIRRYRYRRDGSDSFALALALLEGGYRDIEQRGWTAASLELDHLIPYRNKPGLDFPVLSYTDVLLGRVPEDVQARWKRGTLSELLSGKSVLIGRTSLDAHDIFPTPFGDMPGVEIHAHALEALFHPASRLLREARALSRIALIAGAVLTGFILLLLLRPTHCLGASLVLSFMYLISTAIAYTKYRIILPILPVVAGHYLFLALAGLFLVTVERKEKRFVQGAFGKYLSPSVARTLIDNPSLVRLGGDERTITVLFSDIADFTTLSESMKAPALLELLNEYLTLMSREILKRDGTLDKYIGDAIMAFWGAPVELEDHALRACTAALQMHQVLQVWNSHRKDDDLPSLSSRIGINTGRAVVGNAGSEERFDYTAVGDTVNTASRLEGLGKLYGVSIIISGTTRDAVKDHFDTRILDRVTVKGKKEVTELYELLADKDASDKDFLQVNRQAMNAYFARNWDEALKLFDQKKARYNDIHSEVFITRIKKIMTNPQLRKNHDGVFVLKRK